MRLPCSSTIASLIVPALLGAALSTSAARAADALPTGNEGKRFAVVDLSATPPPAAVIAEIEREVARLRPGFRPIDDQAMRQLLGNGEGPAEAAARLVGEARKLRAAGNCAAAEARVAEAESLALANLSVEEERPLLVDVHVVRVRCADARGDAAAFAAAAVRLRGLTANPPADFPVDLWDARIASAVPPPGTVELFVDTEPANAQVFVSFRAEGVTPRTLKLPPGDYDVEVQKEGFRKAHRRVKLREGAAARAVFRLIDRARDRHDQVESALRSMRKEGVVVQPSTLSRIAQLARVDQLVVVTAEEARVGIAFFDAERGALSRDRITSRFDPATGRVEALADRPTPPHRAAGDEMRTVPGILAPIGPGGAATRPDETRTKAEGAGATADVALPEADATAAMPTSPGGKRGSSPWWAWLIAGAVIAGIGVAVYMDQPQRSSTLNVRAHWDGPETPR